MKKGFKLNMVLLLVVLMCAGAFGFTYAGSEVWPEGVIPTAKPTPTPAEATPIATPTATPEPTAKVIGDFTTVPLYVNGVDCGEAYTSALHSRTYIEYEEFFALVDVDYRYAHAGQMTLEGWPVEIIWDGSVITVNGRYFYMEDGVRKVLGHEVYPIKELAAMVGADVTWDEKDGSVHVSTANLTGVVDGDNHYNEDDLYWLAHIINAESRGQPLQGQMAVGNVVLNRVKVEAYPDTVEDVVFDTQYGIQFSPVESGTIYNDPNEEAEIAAKLCLEGYNVVGESLYFVNNEKANDYWFTATRTFVASIGDHDFYA